MKSHNVNNLTFANEKETYIDVEKNLYMLTPAQMEIIFLSLSGAVTGLYMVHFISYSNVGMKNGRNKYLH